MLEIDYKDLDVLPKVYKTEMVGKMEAIREYFRSFHDVIRAPLTYVTRKITVIQTYVDYCRYAMPDDEMIIKMLNLSADKDSPSLESQSSSIKEHTAEYKIDNRTVYDILERICIHMFNYKYKMDGREAFYAIHLGPNHVNTTSSEAEAAHDGEKKEWNCESIHPMMLSTISVVSEKMLLCFWIK